MTITVQINGCVSDMCIQLVKNLLERLQIMTMVVMVTKDCEFKQLCHLTRWVVESSATEGTQHKAVVTFDISHLAPCFVDCCEFFYVSGLKTRMVPTIEKQEIHY